MTYPNVPCPTFASFSYLATSGQKGKFTVEGLTGPPLEDCATEPEVELEAITTLLHLEPTTARAALSRDAVSRSVYLGPKEIRSGRCRRTRSLLTFVRLM